MSSDGGGPQEVTGFLRYRVPDHQDGAVLLAALAKHGYRASPAYEHGVSTVTIVCNRGRGEERERIREVLAGVHASGLAGPDMFFGPVRFEDELEHSPQNSQREVSANRPRKLTVAAVPDTRVNAGWACAARILWGLGLATRPRLVCRVISVEPTWQALLCVRLLGVRHLAQGSLTAAAPSRTALWLGAGVDCAHAATAVAFAASSRTRRRAGLTSAVSAILLAAFGARIASR